METRESSLTRFFYALEREWTEWLFGYCFWLAVIPTAVGWLLSRGMDIEGLIKVSVYVYLLAGAFSFPVMVLGDMWRHPLQSNIAMTFVASAGLVGFIATVYSYATLDVSPDEHATFVATSAISGGLLASFFLAYWYQHDRLRKAMG